MLAVVLLAGLGVGYWLGSRDLERDNPAAPGAAGGAEQKTLWTCSMHPQVIRDEPGLCPICHMQLVPIGQAQQQEEGSVRVDPAALQALGVRIVSVEQRPLEYRLRAPAELVIPDEARFQLSLRFEAYVERVFIGAEGDPVRQGQPVLEVYSPELLSAQRELLLALEQQARASEATRDMTDRLVEAARERLRLWGIPESFIAELERSRTVRPTVIIPSPVSGIVTRRAVLPGGRAMPGQELLEISRLDPLWLLADVYESDLPWLRLGTTVEVQLPALPGRVLRGVVRYRYPRVEPGSRTVRVRIPLANPGLELLPGMVGTVSIRVQSEPVLAVPEDAVLLSGERAFVIEALGEGRFLPREVVLGRRGEGYYEVLRGLEPGRQLAGGATFLIDSEARLRGALDRLAGAHQGHGTASVEAPKPTGEPRSARAQRAEVGVRIELPTIQCETCVQTIQQAVSGLEGLRRFHIDLERKEARAELDPTRLTLSQLERVIARAGYTANRTRRDPAAYERLPDCCREPEDQGRSVRQEGGDA